MKERRLALAGLAALALAGCSTTPTRVDTGAIRAATFNFVQNGAVKPADFAENRAAIHAMVQEAIAGNLAGRGLTRVDAGGDVTVAYLILVGNNVSTSSINEYFGYGRDDDALLEKAHEASAVRGRNPSYFEAGTLVVDVLDGRTFKLLRRSYAVRPVLRNAPEDVRRERIREAVDEALKNLRVKP